MPGKVEPPSVLGEPGRRLWDSVMDEYELDVHEQALLLEACRTTDALDELDEAVRAQGAIIASPHGDKAHPALVEARAQRIALARILAALRMPAGDADGDQVEGRRPQRRTGVRGSYTIRGIRGGKAS